MNIDSANECLLDLRNNIKKSRCILTKRKKNSVNTDLYIRMLFRDELSSLAEVSGKIFFFNAYIKTENALNYYK